jgi:hypothetical protein
MGMLNHEFAAQQGKPEHQDLVRQVSTYQLDYFYFAYFSSLWLSNSIQSARPK